MCPKSGLKGLLGRVLGEMPHVVRGWGAQEEAEVSNGSSRGGFGFRMRGTLDGVEKQIPIPGGWAAYRIVQRFQRKPN